MDILYVCLLRFGMSECYTNDARDCGPHFYDKLVVFYQKNIFIQQR